MEFIQRTRLSTISLPSPADLGTGAPMMDATSANKMMMKVFMIENPDP